MKRYLIPVVVLAFCIPTLAAVPAAVAAMATQCSRHDVTAPTITLIGADGTVYVYASGGIGGCPKPGSVAGTVNYQHWDGTGWVTDASARYGASWGALYRFARQASNSVTAPCIPDRPLRTYVDGGDGFAPYYWISAVVTFPAHDGKCGELGGGD